MRPARKATPLKKCLRSALSRAVGAKLDDIETLYRENYVRYRNALATVTGSSDSARDAVQHAFAQAVAERSRFRGDGSLAACAGGGGGPGRRGRGGARGGGGGRGRWPSAGGGGVLLFASGWGCFSS